MPEIILPDPTADTANTFYCKKVGLFSRDFEVYRDPEREQSKWLVIDTEGGLFDDNAYICGEPTCARTPASSLVLTYYAVDCTQSRTTCARPKARSAMASACATPRWTSSTTTTVRRSQLGSVMDLRDRS